MVTGTISCWRWTYWGVIRLPPRIYWSCSCLDVVCYSAPGHGMMCNRPPAKMKFQMEASFKGMRLNLYRITWNVEMPSIFCILAHDPCLEDSCFICGSYFPIGELLRSCLLIGRLLTVMSGINLITHARSEILNEFCFTFVLFVLSSLCWINDSFSS